MAPHEAVVRVTQGENGFRVLKTRALAGFGRPPSFSCTTSIRLKLILRTLGAADSNIEAILEQLETSCDAELSL